jgi:mannose-1-phosphate guanylyltransferase/mannose-6-phosphate isomerase
LWNSGIFLYSPRSVIAEAEKLCPELLRHLRQALDHAQRDGRCVALDEKIYAALPAEPFDRVIMERTARGAVVPCAMGWSDVGSWQALWQNAAKDAQGNVKDGAVFAVDTANSYLHSEGPAVAVLGMADVAVVATRDAVLVAPRASAQDMKKLVALLGEAAPDLTQDKCRVHRPWGDYELVARGSHFQVKHITVLPGRALSRQRHRRRAEHWVVVEGQALVECDGVEQLLSPNQSIYIPKEATHRLTNPGSVALHVVEVQCGDYLGEDDIVRLADNYGRVK